MITYCFSIFSFLFSVAFSWKFFFVFLEGDEGILDDSFWSFFGLFMKNLNNSGQGWRIFELKTDLQTSLDSLIKKLTKLDNSVTKSWPKIALKLKEGGKFSTLVKNFED